MVQYGNILENFDFTHGLRHDIMTSHTDGDVIEYYVLTMMPQMTLQLTTIQNMGKFLKNAKKRCHGNQACLKYWKCGLICVTVYAYYSLKISSFFECNWRNYGQNIDIS